MKVLMIIKATNIQKIKKEKDNNSHKINKIKKNTKGLQIKKENSYLKIVIKNLHRNKNIAVRNQQNKVEKDKNKDKNLNLNHPNLGNNKVNIEKHKIQMKFQDLRIVKNRTRQRKKVNIHRINKKIEKTIKNS